MRSILYLILLGTLLAPHGVRAATTEEETLDLMLLIDPAAFANELSRISLDGFLADIDDAHRVGVIALGEQAHPVADLAPAAQLNDREFFKKNLKRVTLESSCKNLNGALTTALKQLLAQRREHTFQAIAVLSNGPYCAPDAAPGAGTGSRDTSSDGDGDLLVTLKYHKIPIYGIALGRGNQEALRPFTVQTGGRLLAVELNDNLYDVLVTVYGHLQHLGASTAPLPGKSTTGGQSREEVIAVRFALEKELEKASAERTAMMQRLKAIAQERTTMAGPDWRLLGVGLVTLVILGLLAVQLYKLSSRMTDDPRSGKPIPGEGRETTTFSNLKLSASRLSHDIKKIEQRSRDLNLDLEDFGIDVWETQNRFESDYAKVVGSVFLLLDHLAAQAKEGEEGKEAKWMRQKLEKLLADERIEPIAAAPGDPFDSKVHNNAGDQASAFPPGTIVEVVRQGFVRRPRGTSLEDAPNPGDPPGKQAASGEILRQTEVIVSRS